MNEANREEIKKAIEMQDSLYWLLPPREYRLWDTPEEMDTDKENYQYWLEEEEMKPETYLKAKYGDDPNDWPGAPYDPSIM